MRLDSTVPGRPQSPGMGTRCRVVAVVGVLASLAAAAPAGARSQPTFLSYMVKRAKIDVLVRFRGDGTAACHSAGLCGYAGTIHYTLPAGPGSSANLLFDAGPDGYDSL